MTTNNEQQYYNEKNRRQNLQDAWLALHDDRLKLGEKVYLPVLSGSMSPTLVPGGKVKIQRVTWKQCSVGDIIILKEKWKLTAHRLLFRIQLMHKCWMYQKGDRNRFGMWVRSEQVVGIVIETVRLDGTSIDLSTPVQKKKARRSAYHHLARDIIRRFLSFLNIVKKRSRF